MQPIRNLIFDVGLFDGSDTAFYLRKGFRVVAVEARPDLCAQTRERFAQEIRRCTLTIVERAVWDKADERMPFYVRSGWSSAFRSSAERDGLSGDMLEVLTTTLRQLFGTFGVPHYLKIDIEGAEEIAVEDLGRCAERPSFVSIEDPNGLIAERLHRLGYDRFQIVNQGYLGRVRCPKPSREGNAVEATFDGKCSGLFGYDLPAERWVSFERLNEQMGFWNRLRDAKVNPVFAYACRRFGKLTNRGWLIGRGWIDIHATTRRTLESINGMRSKLQH